MAADVLTFRIDPEMRESLDAVAAAQDRDRTYVVREALRAYLDLYHWQTKHIEKGLQSADHGKFATGAEVRRTVARLTRK